MTCGIYKITHIASGKCYIGGSINVEKRWKLHHANLKSHGYYRISKNTLNRTPEIRHCGGGDRMVQFCRQNNLSLQDFCFELLEECFPENLREREHCWIRHFEPVFNSDTYRNGKRILPNQQKRRDWKVS